VTDPVLARRFGRLVPLAALVLACAASAACGKKGPPLPPLLRVPVAPGEVSAKRSGDRVVVRFTIPRANQSGVQPADIEAVEVYAWTPPPPDPAAPPAAAQMLPEQIFKYARLVGTVQVRKPPPPPPEQKEGEPPPPPPPPPTGPGLDQGAAAEVVDTLGPADAEPLVVPVKKRKAPKVVPREIKVTPPDTGPPLPPLPARLYVVVGVNHRGKRGTVSQPVRVPLWSAPPAPSDLTATIREGAVDLAWKSPEGLRHPLVVNLAPTPAAARPATPGGAPAPGGPRAAPPPGPAVDRPQGPPPPRGVDDDEEEDPADAEARRVAAMEQAARARAAADQAMGLPVPGEPVAAAPPAQAAGPAGPSAEGQVLPSRVPFPWPATAGGFTVYEVRPADAPADGAPAPPAAQVFPKPLTPAPQKSATFTDPRLEYGVSRCYTVRTSETVGGLSLESASSAPVCVSPSDTFAPAAPKSLGAVSSAGAIALIWEANTEPDLGGYIVLRGVNDGPLEPITPQPVKETTFRDTRVRRGSRYTYAVIAIDTATPPNRSGESNRVEETVR
jgi:hypothetical protein